MTQKQKELGEYNMAHSQHKQLIGAWVSPEFKEEIRVISKKSGLTISITAEKLIKIGLKSIENNKGLLFEK